ncbi:MAG: hypothetical protein NVV63_16250 [Opitutus sp.]|nr:hypothetical protein [Opitutus sp.]
MMPEIWLPTSTVMTGSSVPVAVTDWVISPAARVTVLYSARTGVSRFQKYQPAPAAMSRITITMRPTKDLGWAMAGKRKRPAEAGLDVRV